MHYIIHQDGTFDLLGSNIALLGCYPSVNGRDICPTRVEITDGEITYSLPEGRVCLHFGSENGTVTLSCRGAGLAGIHDFEPIGGSAICGAEHIFVQGFGMEGPSGAHAIGDNPPASHGLTALFNGEQVLLAYARDHRRYSARFCAGKRQQLWGERTAFSAGFNLEGTAGDILELPELYFEEATGLTAGLRHCAGQIAQAMGARHSMPPQFFWSSWYYAYETLDQATLEAYLAGMQGQPFRYVELDAGYVPSLGDWLTPNHRYPGGLELAAKTILEAGFRPGIWIGPFIVGDRSNLYREHPDWVLHDLEGKPLVQLASYTEPKMWGNPDDNYFVLDASHPEALAYLKTVFTTLKRWGFSFFKTDFMLWNMHDTSTVRRYNPSLTSVEIMRNVLSVVREAIGEDSYLLGCIAPFMPFIGYADGMRLAGDCGAQWSATYGPINMLQELPCDNYFNHIFWQNDPDAVLLRDFGTSLSPEETRSLALTQALSGGLVSTSDPVHLLAEDRKQLLKLIQPHEAVTPRLPFFGTDRKELVMTHQLSQGNLLFVMNPGSEERTVFLRLSELFGKENWYQYRYDWTEERPVSVQEDVFLETLAPHDSALVFVTRKPLEQKPANLWDWS